MKFYEYNKYGFRSDVLIGPDLARMLFDAYKEASERVVAYGRHNIKATTTVSLQKSGKIIRLKNLDDFTKHWGDGQQALRLRCVRDYTFDHAIHPVWDSIDLENSVYCGSATIRVSADCDMRTAMVRRGVELKLPPIFERSYPVTP